MLQKAFDLDIKMKILPPFDFFFKLEYCKKPILDWLIFMNFLEISKKIAKFKINVWECYTLHISKKGKE